MIYFNIKNTLPGWPGLAGIFFMLSIASELAIAGDNPQDLFNRGNFFMERENYHSALEVYHDIEMRQFSSGPLFLNMAISYVHLDSLGLAKYYFMKAGNYTVTRDKANDGVTYTENRLVQIRGTLPRLPWISFSEWLYFELNTRLAVIFGIILINTGLIFIVFVWFVDSFQRPLKYSGAIFAMLGMLLVVIAAFIDFRSTDYSRAVMVESQTLLLSHPANEVDVISIIYEGYSFTLDQAKSKQFEGWKFVRLSNGLNGWIDEQVIRKL